MRQKDRWFNRYTVTAVAAGVFLTAAFVGGAAHVCSGFFAGAQAGALSLEAEKMRIETQAALGCPFRDQVIALNGLARKATEKQVVEDANPLLTVYKLSTGQLSFNYPDYNIAPWLEEMDALYGMLRRKGTDFLYIQAPFKVTPGEQELPYGVEDTTNRNADRFLEGLSKRGIPFLDLRQSMREQGMRHADWYFNTDHHWKPETALWACAETAKVLDRRGDFPEISPLFDPALYERTEMPQSFLGSQGRRVGRFYAGLDDFTLVTPVFETDYAVMIENAGGGLSKSRMGAFDESLLDSWFLNQSETETNRYACYLGGDFPLTHITNRKNPHGIKALILQDSYGLPFSSFFAAAFSQTDVMDLRHFSRLSLMDWLRTNSYDVVLMLYNPSVYSAEAENTQFMFSYAVGQ